MIDVVQAVVNSLGKGLPLVVSLWHAGYYMVPMQAVQEYMQAAIITNARGSK